MDPKVNFSQEHASHPPCGNRALTRSRMQYSTLQGTPSTCRPGGCCHLSHTWEGRQKPWNQPDALSVTHQAQDLSSQTARSHEVTARDWLVLGVLVSCSPGKRGNAGAVILPSVPRPPLYSGLPFSAPRKLSAYPLFLVGTTLGSALKRGGDRWTSLVAQ